MTTDPTPPTRRRNTDTSRARPWSAATYARRRHEKYMAEMRDYGIQCVVPPDYDGRPLSDRQTEPAGKIE